MFDVFHNVFGKKKSPECAPEKPPEDEGFVLVGEPANERAANTNMYPSLNMLPAQNVRHGDLPYNLEPSKTNNSTQSDSTNIMSLQDVPFTLHSSLNSTNLVERIWQKVVPSINSIAFPNSLQIDYDFSLEKSVIAETTEK